MLHLRYRVIQTLFYRDRHVAIMILAICTAALQEKRLTLHWCHNDHGGVSNHQPRGCLINCLIRRRSKKTSKLRVTGPCVGNSPGTGEFPAQMASNAENVSIWWRHHASALKRWNVWETYTCCYRSNAFELGEHLMEPSELTPMKRQGISNNHLDLAVPSVPCLVYPMICSHAVVVLRLVMGILLSLMDSWGSFAPILQGCFIGSRAIASKEALKVAPFTNMV